MEPTVGDRRSPLARRAAVSAMVSTAAAAAGARGANLPFVHNFCGSGAAVSSPAARLRGQARAGQGSSAPALHSHATAVAAAATAALGGAALAGSRACRRGRRGSKVSLGPFRRDLTLDGYPIHGPGYYWTLSKCTSAVVIYVPIADDVKSRDVIFSCKEFNLRLGLVPEKGGLVIDDTLLHKVDTVESYYTLDEGEYGERCIAVWLEKLTKEQDWYAYDRFEPVSERFLTEGERKRAFVDLEITQRCYMDIEVDGKEFGRVVIGLFGKSCPRTVENFRCLCTGEKGDSEETGMPLHYKGTRFHRIIQGFCLQGGQTFENDEGSGGESIYGETFEDENLRIKFREPGMLAMANGGPDTNGSQFFITTCKADHLNHNCVGFGKILEGYEIVRALDSLGNEEGDPSKEVVIADCGELEGVGNANRTAVDEAKEDLRHVYKEANAAELAAQAIQGI